MKTHSFFFLTTVLVFFLLLSPTSAGAQRSEGLDDISLTTTSPAARDAFRIGLTKIEKLQTDRAHADFEKAVAADDNFALAHLFLAYDADDPTLEVRELGRARDLASGATPAEQRLVTWLTGARSGVTSPPSPP